MQGLIHSTVRCNPSMKWNYLSLGIASRPHILLCRPIIKASHLFGGILHSLEKVNLSRKDYL